jgi:hypothetical protein
MDYAGLLSSFWHHGNHAWQPWQPCTQSITSCQRMYQVTLHMHTFLDDWYIACEL